MKIKHLLFLVFLYLAVFSVSVATPQDSLKITPANPIQGEPSVYTLNFVITDTLYPDAIIEVIFSNEFDLSNVRLANSTNINGGFTASVNGSKVILQRKGTGRIILPDEKVDVKFGLVQNPKKDQVDFPLTVNFKNGSKANTQKIEQVKMLFPQKLILDR